MFTLCIISIITGKEGDKGEEKKDDDKKNEGKKPFQIAVQATVIMFISYIAFKTTTQTTREEISWGEFQTKYLAMRNVGSQFYNLFRVF